MRGRKGGRRATAAGLFASLLLICAVAHGEPRPTLTAAVEAHAEAMARVSSPRLLHVEIMGQNAVVEVAVEAHGRELRLPLKARRSPGGWEVVWGPSRVYVDALINMGRSETLPLSAAEMDWTAHQRLPSLPIIVTRQQILTPFGAIDVEESFELVAQEELVRHVQRWVRDVLEDAPGPASVDVIADGRVSWQGLHRVMLGVAALGLFRVHLVTGRAEGDELGVFTANLPVFATGLPPGVRLLAIGLYPLSGPLAGQWGVRLATGTEVYTSPESCSPEMSLCIDEGEALPEALSEALTEAGHGPQDFTHMLVATTASTSLAAMMPLIDVLDELVGPGKGRLFLGYIQK